MNIQSRLSKLEKSAGPKYSPFATWCWLIVDSFKTSETDEELIAALHRADQIERDFPNAIPKSTPKSKEIIRIALACGDDQEADL